MGACVVDCAAHSDLHRGRVDPCTQGEVYTTEAHELQEDRTVAWGGRLLFLALRFRVYMKHAPHAFLFPSSPPVALLSQWKHAFIHSAILLVQQYFDISRYEQRESQTSAQQRLVVSITIVYSKRRTYLLKLLSPVGVLVARVSSKRTPTLPLDDRPLRARSTLQFPSRNASLSTGYALPDAVILPPPPYPTSAVRLAQYNFQTVQGKIVGRDDSVRRGGVGRTLCVCSGQRSSCCFRRAGCDTGRGNQRPEPRQRRVWRARRS